MKSTFANVLLGSVLFLVLALGLSWYLSDASRSASDFPWQIENTPDGSIKVFNIQPGVTRLGEFEQRYQEEAELTLFVKPVAGSDKAEMVIEAYFDSITIGGIKAKIVLLLSVDEVTIEAMYNRGVRISTMGSGTRKVTLSSEDTRALRNFSISGITYIPSMNLDVAVIQKRFGEPAQKITDPNNGAVHWLYPDKGLDIALSENDNEVFQYIHPKHFDNIVAPLMQQKTN